MATKGRRGSRSRNRSDLRYFYLNSNLYKILRVNRPQDFVEVWNFTEHRVEGLIWSDVRKRAERAFTLQEVCSMIGRTRVTVELAIVEGKIKAPQRIYTLDLDRKPGKYLFSEKDVLDVHDYFLTVHVGRPRADGKITPGKMPTKQELRAMMRHDTVLYVKNDDGEFVPVWKEVEW